MTSHQELPKAYDAKLVEPKWLKAWKELDLFKANPHSSKKPYCIVIPPPNVTGVLHMGHALVDTLQDILIRWKRMSGYEALWIPGTDHAGISTQTVVERHLFKTLGKRRADFSREEFLEHVWVWKEKHQGQILGQLEKLGCSCDWSRLRFTMDEGCNKAVRACFKKMFDEGLIYRGDYLVNWDPVAETALSDDEVEWEERSSSLWHIRYPIETGGSLVVATTRPETMLGDTAVAVHPDDKRYQKYIGKQVRLPLTHRLIPVIADPFVDPAFGTGAVKITPAHDFNDFEMGRRHNLPLINIMTPDAQIDGRSIEEARQWVVEQLKKEGVLEKTEPHVVRLGVSYRTKATIQPYLSKQWFIRMSHFKEKLLSAVREKRVKLIPPHWEENYTHWIENIRDWCISRQIWWGHRIPIWYNRKSPEEIVCYNGEGEPPHLDPDEWVQDPDVLDTWFSSALWPLSTLGWPDKTPDLQKFYPTSVLVTGHDILFFWVARMIMMGEYLTDEVPFYESFLHGLIYGKSYWKTNPDGSTTYLFGPEKKSWDLGTPLPPDVSSKWEKMSKTKGNVIDPLEISDTYGTDAMRLALCSSATYARQIDLDLRKFEEFKNFANKVWNGSRFVFSHLPTDFGSGLDRSLFTLEDRWILSVFNRTIEEMDQNLSSYAFDRAAMRAYEFFWNDFCSVYLEAIKPVLFGKAGTPELKANKQKLLAILLSGSLRLLHPITPFITEELFSHLKSLPISHKTVDPYTRDFFTALSAPSCSVAPYPRSLATEDISPTVEQEFSDFLELVRAIRNLRGEMQIPPSEKTDLYLSSPLTEDTRRLLLALTPTLALHPLDNAPKSFGASSLIQNIHLFIPVPETLRAQEKQRLEKEFDKLQTLRDSTQAKLANEEFRTKAPAAVVRKLEEALEQAQAQLANISVKLRSL